MIVESKQVHFDETAFQMRRVLLKQTVFVDEEDDSPIGENAHENYSHIRPVEQGSRQTEESRLPQIHSSATEVEVTNMNDVETTLTEIQNESHEPLSNPTHI